MLLQVPPSGARRSCASATRLRRVRRRVAVLASIVTSLAALVAPASGSDLSSSPTHVAALANSSAIRVAEELPPMWATIDYAEGGEEIAPTLQNASGQALDPEMDAILKRLDALEKAAAKPEKKEEKPAEKKPEEKKPEKEDPLAGWTDMSTDKWTVKLGGHVQMDSVNWADTDNAAIPAQNYFEFRRLRLMADGTGYGVYDFRLQIDIEPESGDGSTTPVTDVKDAFLSMNEVPLLDRIRIGNFFVPFGLEQVTNDTNNIFLERSIPTQGIFTADRELGMAFYSINDAMDFTYSGGLFVDGISESTKESIDDNQGQRISGRLTYLPYYDEPSNGRYLIHTGCGVLYTNDQNDIARFRARPQVHEGPFVIDSGNIASGSSTIGNLELATVWGRFAMQSEAFLCNLNRIGLPNENLWGAYVHCSYFLTGENRIYERYGMHGAQFGRQVPFSNFFWVPGCCGPGAWEAKARWSNLTLNEIDSGEYNDLTVGFNWYWSERIRVMFDWIHPVTSPDSTPFGESHSDLLGMRFDFNW